MRLDILQDEELKELVQLAQVTKLIYDAKVEAVRGKLMSILKEYMPEGEIINLNPNKDTPRPEFLCNVTIMRGNSRGTKLFKIVKITSVEPNLTHISLSRWNAEAIPISEKTGKLMSGNAGNISRGIYNKDQVALRGYFKIDID